MARRSPSQLSGRPQVNAITARSKGPGASAPKEEAPLSVNPAVREFVIASAVAKYASFLRAHCSAKSSRFSGLLNGSGHVRIGFWRRRGPILRRGAIGRIRSPQVAFFLWIESPIQALAEGIMALTARAAQHAPDGWHHDQHGLYLQVTN